jgi:hypothetical protein
MALHHSRERFVVAVINSIDIAALIRAWPADKLARFQKHLVDLQFGGVQGSGFEGNTVQYNSPDQLQNMIRMIEVALQQIENGGVPINTARNVYYADRRTGNPWR